MLKTISRSWFLPFIVTLAFFAGIAGADEGELSRRGMITTHDAARAEKAFSTQTGTQDSRIIGGFVAPSNLHKFQVGLYIKWSPGLYSFLCGGSLYKGRYVITAAHCSDFVKADEVVVLAKSRRLFNADKKGVFRKVRRISIHSMWDPNQLGSPFPFDYDVAVWKLTRGVAGVEGPVLARSDTAAGTVVTTTGWGTTSYLGELSKALLALKVPIVDRNVCNGTFSYDGGISDRMICAGAMEGGKDSCQGDSGGPLTKRRADGRRILVGITSFGRYCAVAGYPGVYTRVNHSSIRNFIISKTP